MVFLQPTCLVEAVSFRRTSDETTDEMQLENQTDDIHSTTAFSLSQSQIRMSQAKKKHNEVKFLIRQISFVFLFSRTFCLLFILVILRK